MAHPTCVHRGRDEFLGKHRLTVRRVTRCDADEKVGPAGQVRKSSDVNADGSDVIGDACDAIADNCDVTPDGSGVALA
jgi:hypothetical protein